MDDEARAVARDAPEAHVTRLAFISDVHGDAHALRDALRQIADLGADQVLCCGDLVDYGRFPEETIALLRDRGVPCIRGNHDRWALRRPGEAAASDLGDDALAFLRALPAERRLDVDGSRLIVTHASPGSDVRGIDRDASADELAAILDVARADVLVVGHTHVPFVRRLVDGRVLLNPGALLRDPGPSCNVPAPGTFAVVDLLTRNFTIHRATRA